MSSEIMKEVFKLRDTPCYNLQYTSQFFAETIHSVYNGAKSESYLGPKIWRQIPAKYLF